MCINTIITPVINLEASYRVSVGAMCGPGNSMLKNHLVVGLWGAGEAIVNNVGSQALSGATELESRGVEPGNLHFNWCSSDSSACK